MALTQWEKLRRKSEAGIARRLRRAVRCKRPNERMAVELETIGRLAEYPAREAGR